jgi:hypothetical protein
MDLLKRFGTVYTFPDSQISLSDNFGELVTRAKRLPGANGGFDELGSGRGLSEIGSIRSEFWLFFNNRADATAKIDAIQRMADVGVQRLFMQPTDREQTERWAWARLDNINIPLNAKEQPHKRVRVQLVYQATDPFWYTAGNCAVWAGGAKWADGTKWSGGAPVVVSGTSTTLTLTNSGNAYTQAQIAIRPAAGQTCTDPIVRRIVNGEVVDEVFYLGTLNALDNLFIDSRKLAVRLNNASAYNNQFHAKTSDWIRLLPGANSIQIRFALPTDAASVCIRWLERYV